MTVREVFIFLFFSCLFLSTAIAQETGHVAIKVLDATSQEVVSSATVRLVSHQSSSNRLGLAHFDQVKPGAYILEVQAIGFHLFRDTINKNAGENLNLEVSLHRESEIIEGIEIVGRGRLEKAKQEPIRSVIIDTRAISAQASSLADIMNQSPGIRVRQNGSVGSKPELSINGFQGKAIKYFKDGIPIDYLGEGYNMSVIPLELLDHIQIYKGILPVNLGADALGGAVNLVSNQSSENQLRAYYEIGSFQTHRAGISSQLFSKDKRLGYGLDLNYNYSANNYKALLEVPNPETMNLEKQRLPLFHNAYRNAFAEAYFSIRERTWADELKFSILGFDLEKEQQHPALMTDAYGAVLGKQRTVGPSIRYRKALLDGKLKIDQYGSYNDLISQRIDTLNGRYDWYGNFSLRTEPGESRLASNSEVHEKQWLSRSNFSYQVNPFSKLEFNYVFSNVSRSGEDPLGPKLQGTGEDILSLPSKYQKHVFNLGLENYFFGEKLQNQIIAKHYRYIASGINNTWFSSDISSDNFREVNGNYWGATEALKYQINSRSLVRGSLEYSYRLPEREELFGNNIFIVPNFEMKPERSINASLGYHSRFFDKLQFEFNGFYRRTKDLILLVPIQAPNAQYQNQDQVKGFGFDVDVAYQFNKNYRISGNATWQDLRLFGISKPVDSWKNEARLRNTPYFFANLAAQAKYENLFSRQDELKLFMHYNFMREFYLETISKDLEPGGFLGLQGSANLNSNLIIPNQQLLNVGALYKFAPSKFQLGAEVRNLLNQDLYDYYRVQRPGRSFHLKLSYQF